MFVEYNRVFSNGIKGVRIMNIQRNGQLADNMERASRLRETFETLCERNKDIPVIVEGKRDAFALRELGLQERYSCFTAGRAYMTFAKRYRKSFTV